MYTHTHTHALLHTQTAHLAALSQMAVALTRRLLCLAGCWINKPSFGCHGGSIYGLMIMGFSHICQVIFHPHLM